MGKKVLGRFSIEYWRSKGLTYEEACKKVADAKKAVGERARACCVERQTEAYWAARGTTLAAQKAAFSKKIKESFAKSTESEVKMRYAKRLSHRQPKYWIVNYGLTEEEAVKKAQQVSREGSVRCIEHWIKKGFTPEEAKDRVSRVQNVCGLDSFITRYGTVLGNLAYKNHVQRCKESSKRSIEYWLKRGMSKADAAAARSKYQSAAASSQKQCSAYWIHKGFTMNDAIVLAKEEAEQRTCWRKEYWMKRGFGMEEAEEKIKTIQSELGKRGAYVNRRNHCSKGEKELFAAVSRLYPTAHSSYYIKSNSGRAYILDVYIPTLKLAFEYNGDYWHANPTKYPPNAIMMGGVTAQSIWEKDKNRLDDLKSMDIKTVVIWESDSSETVNEKINEAIK
jgi:hypothetical protein